MFDVPPDFQDGDAITLDDLNGILRALRYLRDVVLPENIRRVRTPAEGIAAGSYANCTMFGRNPTTGATVDGTATIRVWDVVGGSGVAGDTPIIVARINGIWEPIVEVCPASESSATLPPNEATGTGGAAYTFPSDIEAPPLDLSAVFLSDATGTGAGGGIESTGGPPPP